MALLLFLGFASTTGAFGCPCGCGSTFPLSLYPGETWKYRVGLSRQFFQGYVHVDGSVGTDTASPQLTDMVQASIARGIGSHVSIFASLPVGRNYRPGSGSNIGLSDPSMGVRWIANPYALHHPYLPQASLQLTYKQKMGRSMLDLSEATDTDVPIHSNGWNEFLPEVDLLFHIGTAWSVGVSETMIIRPIPQRTKIEGETLTRKAGLGYRTTLNGAYTFYGYGQLSAGVERESITPSQLNDTEVKDSQVLRHTLFSSAQVRVGDRKTLELGLRRTGFVFQNQNTPRYTQVSLGYSQSF
jgi:hypothetical protein